MSFFRAKASVFAFCVSMPTSRQGQKSQNMHYRAGEAQSPLTPPGKRIRTKAVE